MTASLPTLAKLKRNPDWAKIPLFDPTGWKRVRFGDVVENCNKTCDPGEAGLERFFQHAVGTSAGSLSPRTNWSSLTSFEFDLPPLDQQGLLNSLEFLKAILEVAKDTVEAEK